MTILRLLLLLILTAAFAAAQETNDKAQQLAREVWKASGGENWKNIKRVRFTFVVEQDGNQLIAAQHDWDVAGQTDHVKWKGRDGKENDVTVNLAAPGDDENMKAAFGRWTNDSYWLLAPLKVLDPGVNLAYEGEKDLNGTKCEALRLSFGQVGLTPGDQYVLYIDPETKLLRAWDYIGKSGEPAHGSWEKYIDAGGLKLSTEHNFGGRIIRLEGVEVR